MWQGSQLKHIKPGVVSWCKWEQLITETFATLLGATVQLRPHITSIYYMALSHKDWELPNSRIWLAEMDIDRGVDFPI